MPRPDRVLVDTSAFYAMLSSTDDFHQPAARAYEDLIDRGQEVWTTSYILVETIALVHRRLGFASLQPLVETISQLAQVYWIGSRVHQEAWRRLSVQKGQGLSFVDWSTFLVASELGAHVFTFDQGFTHQGTPIIP